MAHFFKKDAVAIPGKVNDGSLERNSLKPLTFDSINLSSRLEKLFLPPPMRTSEVEIRDYHIRCLPPLQSPFEFLAGN